MIHYFDKYLHEANTYTSELAAELGHENEPVKAIRLLRAVLHTIRDRITMSESLDLISQLPMVLKSLYVEQWKYHEKPPLNYKDLEGFAREVEKEQERIGEQSFNWDEPTEDLCKIVLSSLREKYLTEGQAVHVMGQMPKEVRELF